MNPGSKLKNGPDGITFQVLDWTWRAFDMCSGR